MNCTMLFVYIVTYVSDLGPCGFDDKHFSREDIFQEYVDKDVLMPVDFHPESLKFCVAAITVGRGDFVQ